MDDKPKFDFVRYVAVISGSLQSVLIGLGEKAGYLACIAYAQYQNSCNTLSEDNSENHNVYTEEANISNAEVNCTLLEEQYTNLGRKSNFLYLAGVTSMFITAGALIYSMELGSKLYPIHLDSDERVKEDRNKYVSNEHSSRIVPDQGMRR